MEKIQIKDQVLIALNSLLQAFPLNKQHILVVGVSTSEVAGQTIGSAGSEIIAREIYEALEEKKIQHGFGLAFQGCEHINRALIVERALAEKYSLETVSVVPVRNAGGAMSAYAYSQMKEPVIVEFIKADAGIDIGDTFIGMHLKHVAVPIRAQIKQIGEAHLTMAKTRPKLIGGIRAQYAVQALDDKTC